MLENPKISIIGLGYVGLPTAILAAASVGKVRGVDIDPARISALKDEKSHIDEDDLNNIFKKVIGKDLIVSQNLEESDIFVICVPTPLKAKTKTANLDFVEDATNAIAKKLKKGDLIILESTSPVGTLKKLAQRIASLRRDLKVPQDSFDDGDVFLAYCPERILPGNSINELVNNDRIIGGINHESNIRAAKFYNSFVKSKLVFTSNAETAEMAKLSENAFRDVNIAFANELSILASSMGVDIWELIKLTNMHPRVDILKPGPGVGGHCIPLDPWFLIADNQANSKLMTAARNTNIAKEEWVVKKIQNALAKDLFKNKNKPTINVYGLTYKADVGDIRESPSISIIEMLCRRNEVCINIIDPFVNKLPEHLYSLGVTLNLEQVPDISVILVNHTNFKDYEFKGIIVDIVGLTISQPSLA